MASVVGVEQLSCGASSNYKGLFPRGVSFAPFSAACYAYWITVNYREAYGLHASNGILFNHESPRRGETFVTRKVTRSVAAIAHGKQDVLFLGNLNARRDWGHTRDYVDGMWRILQLDKPDDYVLATGKAYSVREFVELAFAQIGTTINWQGKGIDEQGVCSKTGRVYVRVDTAYFRPTEVDVLIGNPAKALRVLGWRAKTTLPDLVAEMVRHDLAATANEASMRLPSATQRLAQERHHG